MRTSSTQRTITRQTLLTRTSGVVVAATAALAAAVAPTVVAPATEVPAPTGPTIELATMAAPTALTGVPAGANQSWDPAWYEGPVDRYDPAWDEQPRWAMAVVVTDRGPDDPRLWWASDMLSSMGAEAHVGSVDCDLGARAGLALRPDKTYWYTVLYFRTQEEAFYFKDSHGLSIAGIIPVTSRLCDDC